MNPLIFREYDIRGVAERDLPDEVARDIGRAFGTLLKRRGARHVALGRDCRLSSERLQAALSEGIRQTGLWIVDIGQVATPLMYFTVFHRDLDGGAVVTGSHNPPEDNGVKLMAGKQTLAGPEIRKLREMVDRQDFDLEAAGGSEEYDPLPAYSGYMRGNIQLQRNDVAFAIDAGNGMGGPVALAAMHTLGLKPDPMYCDVDGEFPHHHPDPTQPENIADLAQRVRERGHEVGIAYDGDADRIAVIDADGLPLWGDRLVVLFARSILADHPGATILGEVKCSQSMYDDIAARGGRPIIWKTGHSLIKQKMKEENALLAGEMSGHIFFADRYYGYDDAVYASLRLLEILSQHPPGALDELLSGLPATHATPEIRVACPDDVKFDVVSRLLERFRQEREVVDIDGARILFDGGWGLVRASNTQPALVMRFEASDEDKLQQIQQEIEQAVREASSPG
ncbi:MAG: phosphomannomutase/phosphoglucomutase [Proteobacteria bacterium]|nr:phosphomannomutase/phosphoglucomutase [Pseudomonadota bacterium]